MNKINRNQFVAELVKRGHSEKSAKEIYGQFLEIIQENLLEKRAIHFSKIGTLVPKYTPKNTKMLFGEVGEYGDTMSIDFKTSKSFSKLFKKNYSEASKVGKSIRSIGRNFN